MVFIILICFKYLLSTGFPYIESTTNEYFYIENEFPSTWDFYICYSGKSIICNFIAVYFVHLLST